MPLTSKHPEHDLVLAEIWRHRQLPECLPAILSGQRATRSSCCNQAFTLIDLRAGSEQWFPGWGF